MSRVFGVIKQRNGRGSHFVPTLKASSHHTAGAYLLFNIRYNTVKNNFRKPFPGRINIRGDKKKRWSEEKPT